LAVNGVGFISLDMRGFGRCHFDDNNQFSTATDNKKKVNYEKSYEDIVQLAQLIKQKYPDTKLIALGESLGCTFCVRLAAEHQDLINGLLLSAPAVHLNNEMFAGRGQVRQGIKAMVKPRHEIDMTGFFAQICSQRKDVQDEMLDDPLILKSMPMRTLIATDKFVGKTANWGKTTDPHLPILIVQGSADGCVSPKHVVDLLNKMPSDDQTLAWRGNFGHLQLETCFMRAPVIDAVVNWLSNHEKDHKEKLQIIQQSIADLGGTITK
jgi:alpha-beta hydrolase superfamily lysophospholipase